MGGIPPFVSFLKSLKTDSALLAAAFFAAAMIFVNGLTDAPVAIAPAVNSGAVGYKRAVLLAAVCNLAGSVSMILFGSRVAVSIYDISGLTPDTPGAVRAFASAMAAVAVWSLAALYFGLPTSESHALMAALAGASVRLCGLSAVDPASWLKILLGMAVSTVPVALCAAAAADFLSMRIVKSNRLSHEKLCRFQTLGAAFNCFSHGAQDGSKFAGVFTVAAALCLKSSYETVTVPAWTALLSGVLISAGMLLGGRKIVKSMGAYTPPDPADCIAADLVSSAVLTALSFFGIPVSTTHAKVSALAGIRLKKKSPSGKETAELLKTAAVWLLTFPVCGALGFLLSA